MTTETDFKAILDSHPASNLSTEELMLQRYGLYYRWELADDYATRTVSKVCQTEETEGFAEGLVRLLNDSLWYASMALADNAEGYDHAFSAYHLDDHQDYTNAIRDQISWILETLQEDHPMICEGIEYNEQGFIHKVLALLNMTYDEAGNQYPELGFQYGYADHFTPISDIALMNKNDD